MLLHEKIQNILFDIIIGGVTRDILIMVFLGILIYAAIKIGRYLGKIDVYLENRHKNPEELKLAIRNLTKKNEDHKKFMQKHSRPYSFKN